MLTAPETIMRLLEPFRPVFSERVWGWALELLLGAILAPGRRTVTRILRVIGRGQEPQFQNYHRVLNRAVWSGRALSERLLRVLVATFVPAGAAIVLGGDETLERRRGAHIAELGCYRDAARSTARNKVKSMGLRWLSLMLIVPLPWDRRPWALPFLTVSAPSPAVDTAQQRRHKTSVDWLRQMVLQVVRWLPGRRIVLVADGGLASVDMGHCCQRQDTPVTYVTRLRLDARLFDPPPDRPPGTRGRKRVAGARQPKASQRLDDPNTNWQPARLTWADGKSQLVEWVSGTALWYVNCKPVLPGRWVLVRGPHLKPCLLFCTDPEASPQQILDWYAQRWNVEVTFEEVRAHLGFETQRQWNALAIARSSPALLGLFSLVTWLAHQLLAHPGDLPVRSTAWYPKSHATFADCLAFVRSTLWTQSHFPTCRTTPANGFIPASLLEPWLDLLCYAA
jgi:hypothetical protein